MSQEPVFGAVNGHLVGIAMKEWVRRAINLVRRERFAFEAKTKTSYAGEIDADVFTNVDVMAQAIYLRGITEAFPDCGLIGEEDNLRIESKNGCYFTVDPIDGTKAFVRRQSHGITTMIALVYEQQVLAAFIGDINTGEIFGYRPGSDKVWRITELDSFQVLPQKPANPNIKEQKDSYALLRDPLPMYSKPTQRLVEGYKNHEVMGSSIGAWAARLWKGEVQTLALREGYETPWDSTPVIGISQKLGYEFLKPKTESVFSTFIPEIPTDKYRRNHDVIIT